MLRRGVPYGEEVSAEEKSEKKTLKERGLAFTCYTSTLSEKLQGFRFVQRRASTLFFHTSYSLLNVSSSLV